MKSAYDAVESAYTTLITSFRLEDSISDEKAAASELRAYTRLLSVALAYCSLPAIRELALSPQFRPILAELMRWPEGISGRDLAERLKAAPETIARKLPRLRDANLVRSQQVGKANINTITAEARDLLEQEASEAQEREPQRAAAG